MLVDHRDGLGWGDVVAGSPVRFVGNGRIEILFNNRESVAPAHGEIMADVSIQCSRRDRPHRWQVKAHRRELSFKACVLSTLNPNKSGIRLKFRLVRNRHSQLQVKKAEPTEAEVDINQFIPEKDRRSEDVQSWKQLYRAAVLETDIELVPRRILEARKAAGQRAMQLIREEAAVDEPDLQDLVYASVVLDKLNKRSQSGRH